MRALAFTHDGAALIFSGGSESNYVDSLRLVDLKDTPLLLNPEGPVVSLAISPDGKTLATGDTEGTARLFGDLGRGHELAAFTGHAKLSCQVAFSPDGRLLAVGGGGPVGFEDGRGQVKVWDLKTKRAVADVVIPNRGVTSLAFSPDGRLIATGHYDGTVTLWATPRAD